MTSKRAEQYCNEDITLIENYEQAINDETQIWHCHHRLEIDENKTYQQLIDEGKYYNRPASELIFLTSEEHNKLHGSPMKDKHHSEESKQKLSESLKGRDVSEETRQKRRKAMLGKKMPPCSEETKKKISKAKKGKHLSEETKRKISEANKGHVSPMKGKVSPFKNKHHSEESKQKLREAILKYWENKRNEK